MIEIRIHGRGGQGAVTSGQILAIAAFYDNKQSQSFPIFGVERSGAPVEAFVRISEEKINIRSQVYAPDVVIVLEPSLIKAVDVAAGLKKKGLIVVNSHQKNNEVGIKGGYEIRTIDATSIAMKIFGRPIVNTAMLGAFSKINGLVSLDSLKKAIDEIFLGKKGKAIADLNKKAVEEVYNKTR